ncbi:MAG TPA: hypothetical protein VGC53_14935 [Vicinamibacteria bacterium]
MLRTAGGGSWNRDDVIVFSPATISPLHRVSAAGGVSEPITGLDEVRGDNTHRHPHFLPDGRRFLYLARNRAGAEQNAVLLGSLDGGESRKLLPSPAAAIYASGHLLFLHEQSLMAQRFDLERATLLGEATSIAAEVVAMTSAAVGFFSASQTGELIYLKGESSIGNTGHLELVDRTGKSQGTLRDSLAYMDALFPSSDGRSSSSPSSTRPEPMTCGSMTSSARVAAASPSIPIRKRIPCGRRTDVR